MSTCPFCGHTCSPLHPITIAGAPRRLMRCPKCEACSPDAPVPEQQLLTHYNSTYFSQAGWEITKSRLLACDYVEKAERHGLIGPGEVFLEIGCSYGHFAEAVRLRTGVRPDVLELSLGCQRYLRENFPDLNLRGSTLSDLPVEPRYTRVFGFHLLEHLLDPAAFLRALALRMAPGGLVFFLTPNASSLAFRRYRQEWGWSCPDQHCVFFSPFISPSYFASTGFALEAATSSLPALIHTPSQLLPELDRLACRLAPYRVGALSFRTSCAKVGGRLLDWLRRGLRQNDPQAHLLPLERFFHSFRGPNRHDELQLVLRRHG